MTSRLGFEADDVAFIAIARLKEISGFSKSTILRKIKAGEMPRPVIESGNTRRWCLRECLSWREAQFRKRAERIAAERERASA